MGKFSDIKNKTLERNKQEKKIKEWFDKTYPNWENTKDAKHIKMRIAQTVKAIMINKSIQKRKVIKKANYKGEWPFISNQITIIKTGKLWITCIIDGKEYALNGLTQVNQPWLKFPHDAGKAIIGKDVGPFIQIGLKL